MFKTNYKVIKETLSEYDWLSTLNSDFVSDYPKCLNILTSALESNSPLTKPAKKKKNLYMTSEAIRIKDKKVKLRRKT